MKRFFIFLLLVWSTPALAADPCHAEIPCTLGDRTYHVLEPDGWDGVSPLPVMLHFHGWGRSGAVVVNHGRIAGATRERGVLLIAPSGRNRTWGFWRPGASDTRFAEDLLRTVAERYPIDPEQIYISGYSYGSAMAWRFSCESDVPVRALLAVAGTLNQTETCASAPAEVRHTHGLDDTVLPYPMGANGDQTEPVRMWRNRLGCTGDAHLSNWSAVNWFTFTRHDWTCAEGRVILDVHPASHLIPRGWIAQQLDELLPANGR